VSKRILKQIEALVANPRPSGAAKLEGAADLWRVRIGDWRVVYRIYDRDRLVDVIAIRHRRDVYR
jgi:mRNA interferase RelE/StbE